MRMTNRLAKNAKNKLLKAYKSGKQTTRSDIKAMQNGRHAQYETISSEQSLNKHLSAINSVSSYLQTKYRIRDWNKVEKHMIIDFLEYQQKNGGREGLGASDKTLKGYVTAINKVMVLDGSWNSTEVVSLTKLNIERGRTNVYKDLTSSEWILRNEDKYEKYKEQIDFSRAFGLRREEMFGQKGMHKRGKNGLTTNSFLLGDDGILKVQTIGKGGKLRIAPCRSDMNSEMMGKYGQYARLEYEVDVDVERFKVENAKGQYVLRGMDNAIPLHIHRSDYARNRIIEECAKYPDSQNTKKIGYSRIGMVQGGLVYTKYVKGAKIVQKLDDTVSVKIKTLSGNALAFMEVSQNLGHNRLDVMVKYL